MKKGNIKINEILDYCDRKKLYIEYYKGIKEPGYSDVPSLLANWNTPKLAKISNFIERNFNKETELDIKWSDEWVVCEKCNKGIRTILEGGDFFWTPYYKILNNSVYYLLCNDCYEEETKYDE